MTLQICSTLPRFQLENSPAANASEASLTVRFRLRKFGVHDITSFPVSIDMDALGGAEAVEEDGEDEGEKKEEAASTAGKKNIKLFKVPSHTTDPQPSLAARLLIKWGNRISF